MFYYDAMHKAWDKIWAVVSQNSEKRYDSNSPNGEDIMEKLLSRRKY
jgi:hypothetical protein